jgi:hypothetical protein
MYNQRPRESKTTEYLRHPNEECMVERGIVGAAVIRPSTQAAVVIRLRVSAGASIFVGRVSTGLDSASIGHAGAEEGNTAPTPFMGECSPDKGQTGEVRRVASDVTDMGEVMIETRQPGDSTSGTGIASGEICLLVQFSESRGVFSPPTARVDTDASWLEIDEDKKIVSAEGMQIPLSRKEYEALVFFRRKLGTICSREELIAEVWPDAFGGSGVSESAIDQLIHRLRKKIEADPEKPTHLISRRGFGYVMR